MGRAPDGVGDDEPPASPRSGRKIRTASKPIEPQRASHTDPHAQQMRRDDHRAPGDRSRRTSGLRLKELDRVGQPLEPAAADRDERGIHDAGRQRAHRPRDEHLVSARLRADARRRVHRRADVPLGGFNRLPRMDPDPDVERIRRVVVGRLGCSGGDCQGALDRRARAVEDDVEAVALRTDLRAVGVGHRRAHERAVSVQHGCRPMRAMALDVRRVAPQVGEQEAARRCAATFGRGHVRSSTPFTRHHRTARESGWITVTRMPRPSDTSPEGGAPTCRGC